jgi:hypothetical protein
MHRLVHALIGTLPLAACHAAGQVRSSPPPSIVAALAPMMIETGVRVACLADTLGVPAGTVPIDLLLTSDSGASSSVVRVVFTRTPPSNQQPVLTFELGEIGQSRRVGESCGSRARPYAHQRRDSRHWSSTSQRGHRSELPCGILSGAHSRHEPLRKALHALSS